MNFTRLSTETHYVDRDSVQLEPMQEKLYASLRHAWHSENYRLVVSLVADLLYLVGRRMPIEEGEHVLLMGIQACHHMQDKLHLAQFLSRLSGLHCTRDQFELALRRWRECEEVSHELGHPITLWEPFFQLAHIVDLLEAFDLSERFAEQLIQADQMVDRKSMLLAFFIRGFHARARGENEGAKQDYITCLHLLTEYHLIDTTSPYTQFFVLTLQAELARIQGMYQHARSYGDAALGLARTFCDPYTVSALLIDQTCYAYQQGMFHDAYHFAQQLLDNTEITTPSYHTRGGHHILTLLADYSLDFRVVLSTREQQVLQLVASGSSNQDIATELVISLGTVKKHIEHIYIKLDATSRTHAIARARTLNLLH